MTNLFHLLNQSDSPEADDALRAVAAALLYIVRHDSTIKNRVDAAAALTHVQGRVNAAQLLPALDDSSSKVRLNVIRVLRQMPDEAVIVRLVQCLDDVDPMVRAEVLETLVENKVSSVTAVPNLVAMLNDSNPTIRTNAAQALGRTNTAAALQPLIRHLQDPDSRVSLAAATALGQLAFADAAAPLFDLARDENTYYRLRDAALEALVQINPPDMNRKLFSLLDVPELSVRKAVLEVMYALESEADVARLLDVADWHTSLVRPVRNALVRCGGEAVEGVMIASVGHVRQWVRALAVEVLGEIHSTAATPHILPLLSDEMQEVRLLAVNALGDIGDERAVPDLIATLKDPVWLVQVAASSALARIDSVEARRASVDWQKMQRGRPSSLDLDTDEPPPDVDLSDIM